MPISALRLSTFVLLALLVAPALRADDEWLHPFRAGDDLRGWRGDATRWSVADGVLSGRTTADAPLVRASYLVWEGELPPDFELVAELRLHGGNSGIQFRSRVDATGDLHGYQADLDAAHAYTGAVYHNDRGLLALRGEDVTLHADGTRGVRALGDADELARAWRDDAWNTYRVVARGARLELFVNGVPTARLVDRQAGAARDGRLALQLHQGDPMAVELRALRVRALPPDPDAAPPPAAPAWIWTGEPPRDGELVEFASAVELSAPAARATLTASCDNRVQLFLDDELVLEGDDWTRPVAADVTAALSAPGTHRLAARCTNEGGPAALIARLTVESADGETRAWWSDASWRWRRDPADDRPSASRAAATSVPGETASASTPTVPDHDWRPAVELAPLGGGPWSAVDLARFERAARRPGPRDPLPDDLRVADGFVLERLLRVPREQGSWVALCVDPRGRLYASDQYDKGLWRVTLGAGADTPPRVEALPAALSGAQGLTWFGDALYAVVNANGDTPSGLYRVTDRDGDDRLEHVERLRQLEGAGEHGWHGIAPTPDGEALVIAAGNSTRMPRLAGSRVPLVWGEDQPLPPRPDANGHQAGVLAPGGCVYRVDPEGRRWELLSVGYRNPYDLAFARDGALFTFDADMEWDVGTPWYRPTRVCLVTSGSEYGWRNGSGKWPAHHADSLPAVLDVGLGSPVGLASGHHTNFPPPWDDALFLGDWSYGRLHAALLRPDGAAYAGELHTLVTGRPFPVTDMVAGPLDGALYLITGGRSVDSALYRLRWVGDGDGHDDEHGGTSDAVDAARASPDASADARALRRRLEQLHGAEAAARVDSESALATIWPALDHPDRFVRFAARVALEWQPVASWREAALDEPEPRRALAALLALVRVSARDAPHRADAGAVDAAATDDLRARVLSAVARVDDALAGSAAGRGVDGEPTPADRTAALDLQRVLTLAHTRLGPPDPLERRWLLRRFSARLPGGSPALDLALVRLLVRLDDPTLAARAAPLLRGLPTQERQLELAMALVELRSGWTPALRRELLAWFERARAFAGGSSFAGYVRRLEQDALAKLPPADRESWLAERAAARGDTAPAAQDPLLAGRTAYREWTVDEVLAAAADRAQPDPTRGARLFAAVGCYACHRVDGQGGVIGPDLSGVGRRFGPRDLAEALVAPNAVVSDLYATTRIETFDGDVIRGQIVNLTSSSLMVSTDATRPDQITYVPRDDIADMAPSDVSPMPEGLLGLLEADEVADLLAFLRAGGPADAGSPGG